MSDTPRKMTREEYSRFLDQREKLLERQRLYHKQNPNSRSKLELELVEGGLRIIRELQRTVHSSTESDIAAGQQKAEEVIKGLPDIPEPNPPENQGPLCAMPGCDRQARNECPYCHGRFCNRHGFSKAHDCPGKPHEQPVPAPLALVDSPPATPVLTPSVPIVACAFPSCQYTSDKVKLRTCSECRKNFCHLHRDLVAHDCPSLKKPIPTQPLVETAAFKESRPRFRGLRRVRVRWGYVFLLLWVAAFAAGLYVVPKTNLVSLMFESFINGFVVFFFVWGIAGIARRGFPRKAFAVILLLFLMGLAVQNQTTLAGLGVGSAKGVYTLENNGIAPFLVAANQTSTTITPSVVPSTISIPTTISQPSFTASSSTSATKTTNPSSSSGESWLSSDPSFVNGNASIDYPPGYNPMANYILGVINTDRASAGLAPVTLSSIPSAQQHADSMAYFGYFSHWDVQGYKPYMRYTLLGGTGSVAENVGQTSCTTSPPQSTLLTLAPCSTQNIESGLADSEWGMMNADVACCNNGHRDNILDPMHTSVSIGIAYDSSGTLYFVEDFEDSYLQISQPIQNTPGQIHISGEGTDSSSPWGQVSTTDVYYDATPAPMTVQQLDATDAYDPGTFVGGVLPPCLGSCAFYPGSVTAYASSWQTSATSADLSFSMSSFFSADGPGVYTIYVQTSDSTGSALMMYSVFYSS